MYVVYARCRSFSICNFRLGIQRCVYMWDAGGRGGDVVQWRFSGGARENTIYMMGIRSSMLLLLIVYIFVLE